MSRLPAAKKRRLSPPDESTSGVTDKFYQNAAKWNLEEDYQQRARKKNNKEKKDVRLPIKTAEGRIERAPVQEVSVEKHGDPANDPETEDVEDTNRVTSPPAEASKPQIPVRQQILEAKEDLARIAGLISEDPEENIAQSKHLVQYADSKHPSIKKLALATQLAIYKDIIPGYRIRPASEEELKAKLSKDVKKLRNFEQALVGGYHGYVLDLKRTAKGSSPDSSEVQRSVASVAISCACTLLNTVPHFNFRGDLLGLIIDKLSTRQLDQDFFRCRDALETLFENDEDGNASLEAVTLLTRMMKTKSYHIHESVLNTFLHLRLLSEFAHRSSTNRIDKEDEENAPLSRPQKQKREFRTKKQRKLLRERKGVEKEMKEADAVVSHEERDKNQSEMLKLVFVAYFRILKARLSGLMGAVLEGLARYAHLINQDFFGDILEALRDLITSSGASDEADVELPDGEESPASRDLSRESLLCVITAFALLQGQDAAKSASSLHLDLNFFITHLYRTLLLASMNPDVELSSQSLHLPDPDQHLPQDGKRDTKVNVQTTIVLLLRSLKSTLLPTYNVRAVPPVRLAAFTKQLLIASLQLPEKSSLAMIGLLHQVTKIHGSKIAALWSTEETRGDGKYDPLREELEASNPFASTAWEGELLRQHYCPSVRDAIVGLEKGIARSRT